MNVNAQNSENKKTELSDIKSSSPKKDVLIYSPEKKKEKYLDLNIITRKWRVKLYKLNSLGQWDDHGIGYVFCASKMNPDNNEKINKLIMLDENTNEEMFCIELNENKAEFNYQRSTIMTWKTDNEVDDDSAISFQEKEGLIEIIKSIYSNEGKNIDIDNLIEEVNNSGIYMEVSTQNLPTLAKLINADMGEMRLSDFIKELKENNFEMIIKLGDLVKDEEKKIENLKTNATSCLGLNNNFKDDNDYNDNDSNEKNKMKEENNANVDNNDNNINKNEVNEIIKNNEDDNNDNNDDDYNQQLIYKNLPMQNINYIFNIFKNLILIGDKSLIEALMDDELYLITFGALEYDFETMKSIPHRKYFKNIVKFKNPLNIKNSEILKKINQNLRLTYLRDTALSRLIEDNAVKSINSILQYNHNDIIQFFLNNPIYLELLLNQLKNEDLNIKKQSCLFLSELIDCSKDVLQTRSTFAENLFENGILLIIGKIIEDNLKIINDKDKNDINEDEVEKREFIKISAIEIFMDILSSIPNVILDYLKQETDHQLLKQITNIMLYSDNFGIKYEIFQVFKALIEAQLKEKTIDRMELFSEPFKILLKYLQTPFGSPPPPHKKKLEISGSKQIIIEILITWFNLMNFNKQYWIEENKLDEIIINLLEDIDKVINLYTVKLLKCIIEISDAFICNKILSEKLCNNLIKLFSNNMKNNNIIISCMMDFFEALSKKEEIIFNNAMIFLSDFFNENKKYFNIIIMRYNHKPTPKKELINYIKNDYRDIDLFLNDYIDFKFMDDEDKAIDYLSKKREREEHCEEFCSNGNNLLEDYKKKYINSGEYYHKNGNDEGKNDDIFKNFEINNINSNNNNNDEEDDYEDYYYHFVKK